MDKLIELTRKNLWTAVDDYRRHTYEPDVLDDISDNFINRLAIDTIESKRELRELFSKSQGWDENLQAIVINGTKTHKSRLRPRQQPRQQNPFARKTGRLC